MHAMCAGRGECSCGACVCSSSMLDDSVAPYRGSGCECPPEEEICLNPEDGVSISCDNYTFSYCNGYNNMLQVYMHVENVIRCMP